MKPPRRASTGQTLSRAAVVAALAAASLAGCTAASTRPPADGAQPAAASVGAPLAGRLVTFKSPTCSCCGGWERYMRVAGWAVESRPTIDMAARKEDLGVPGSAGSCHTSVIQGYVVEGHVPLPAIELLLRQRPDIVGIALPGMAGGSPGMDGQASAPFAVLAIERDGSLSPFGSFPA